MERGPVASAGRPRAARPAVPAGPGAGAATAPAYAKLAGGNAVMTVNLTRIYTKLGDGGETHLGDMSRVSKLHPRVEAYGTVDELNATIGVALLAPDMPARSAEWLRRVQNDLLDLGADLSVPEAPADAGEKQRERTRLRVTPEYTRWLELACDEANAGLEPLRSFVIPGGTPAAAQLHVCRTVCRRAERRAIAVGEEANPEVVRYLNRLSDLLFILSRDANAAAATDGEHGQELPGGEGEPGGDGQPAGNGRQPGVEPLWEPGAHSPDAHAG